MAKANALDRIGVGTSVLTGEIYLYRFGADRLTALDKRPAEPMVMSAVIEHMMHGENGTDAISKVVRINGNAFRVTVEPVEANHG